MGFVNFLNRNNTKYSMKGKTLLRSRGVLSGQILHVDEVPDCNCGLQTNNRQFQVK